MARSREREEIGGEGGKWSSREGWRWALAGRDTGLETEPGSVPAFDIVYDTDHPQGLEEATFPFSLTTSWAIKGRGWPVLSLLTLRIQTGVGGIGTI